ncbi:restriction endonuclease [Agrilutibacter solisilvae]|uniref:restriction endonuclease n=1 Tax=Agrilutibacter solisilvae TaxID=2763317 RepID=UPI001FD67DEC|nr:restriction endonuclease [Lysobacter solisilvae]
MDALSPDSLERFSADLAKLLHGQSSKVSRYGDRGHKQEGLDVIADLADGTRITYQCKRHSTFGQGKIDEAVAAHTALADSKVILFTGLASPRAREHIRRYPGWELWDREDITRQARLNLSKVDLRRLVDSYFPGQRLALLGETEPSVWRTPEEFFAAMSDFGPGFSHAWKLVGRKADTKALIDFVRAPNSCAIAVLGAGGAGKTRLLKELTEDESTADRRTYFLSREPLTSRELEALGAGEKLLICDDAHEREDIALLASYVAHPSNRAKLILALRPYGLRLVREQSTPLADLPTHELGRLSAAEAEQLACSALVHFGADKAYARRVAEYTKDCPLATVLAAQVLGKGEALPEFLHDEERFRSELFARLIDSTVRGISLSLNESHVRTTLAAIALLQPITDLDAQLASTLSKISELPVPEVNRIIKRLRDAGVLFERGAGSRIAPDLLADFLIEDAIVSAGGGSNGFAEEVFDLAPAGYAGHVLANLGRLDWRRSSGMKQSKLLDDLWGRLRWSSPYANPHLRAAAAAAFYQPSQALAFVRRMISNGHLDDQLAVIARNAAYNEEGMADAFALLWEIGQNDSRPTNQHPNHAIRLLSELAAPEPDKSVYYMEQVVDFMLSLLPYESSWTGAHTPLDVLTSALSTEGYTTSATARAISMVPFSVRQAAVAGVRAKVIDACIALLTHTDVAKAHAAAGALGEALQAPRGLLGATPGEEARESWNAEFLSTLQRIRSTIESGELASTVLTRLGSVVSWLSQYGQGAIRENAQAILESLNRDMRTSTVRMLVDGWGHLTRERYTGGWEDSQRELAEFAEKLVDTYPADGLADLLESCLEEIQVAKSTSSHILMDAILGRSADLASLVLDQALHGSRTQLSDFAGMALAHLRAKDSPIAMSAIEVILVAHQSAQVGILAEAYSRVSLSVFEAVDITALRAITASDEERVHIMAAGAVRQVSRVDMDLAIDLLLHANLAVSSRVAHEYLLWLTSEKSIQFERLTLEQVETLLSKIEGLKSIGDYWIEEFLRKSMRVYPRSVLDFLKRRVIRGSERERDWEYRAIPRRPSHGNFGLMAIPEAGIHLRELFDWALADDSVLYLFGDMIESCCTFDANLVSFMDSWLSAGTERHYEVVSTVLREAPNGFVFEHQEFVIRLLRASRSFGPQANRTLSSALYAASVSGMRMGSPGEPFPQDLRLLDRAQQVLAGLGKHDPAFKLFDDLRKHAELEIANQREEGRNLDRLDEDRG